MRKVVVICLILACLLGCLYVQTGCYNEEGVIPAQNIQAIKIGYKAPRPDFSVDTSKKEIRNILNFLNTFLSNAQKTEKTIEELPKTDGCPIGAEIIYDDSSSFSVDSIGGCIVLSEKDEAIYIRTVFEYTQESSYDEYKQFLSAYYR